jgi:preprotein translocase subunit SecA
MAGRGTDILLGGNPDGLVEEILAKQGLKLEQATPEQEKAAREEAKRLTEVERAEVVKLGGLHIVGTERHEARRIDNQLRGRAGRQGDPGSSRFYLSLEDDLMRRFGPMERVKGIMERMGVEDDVPIEAGLINRSIEGAQTRVEGYNFDIRKHTVEFDDVMNKQRTIIYADRRAILEGQDMRDRILQMIGEEIGALVDQHLPADEDMEWDVEALLRAVRTIDPLLAADITPDFLEGKSREEVEDLLLEQVEDDYETRETAIAPENMRYVERRMMLGAIDRQWIDYLTGMEDLRQEIGMQAIAQRDPLVEYQRNAYGMFDELKRNIQRDIVYQIIPVSFQYEQYMRQVLAEQQQRLQVAQHAGETEEQAKAARTVRKQGAKIGRNDLCPCGSGKKFKHCHEGREGELFALLSSGGGIQAQQSVSAQLATGHAGAQKPATPARPDKGAPQAQRGRAVPQPQGQAGNGKNKPQQQVQRGKGQAKRK